MSVLVNGWHKNVAVLSIFSLAAVLFAFCFLLIAPKSTHAIGLKVAPLLYNETLIKGEKKKGFIDISNPNDKSTTFTSEVSAFKQINKNGDLAFYDASQYKNGITFDYNSFTLGPRESLRMYFLLDANKLPKGGVYAALFFRTTENNLSPDSTSIQPASRVGTLLVVDNGGGGIKNAAIEKVDASFFQFGDGVKATTAIKNIGGSSALAFFPSVQTQVQPFGGPSTQTLGLIFPGITRDSTLKVPGTYFGFVRLRVTSGNSTTYKWVFAATGKGRIIALTLFSMAFITAVVLVYIRKRNKPKKTIHN